MSLARGLEGDMPSVRSAGNIHWMPLRAYENVFKSQLLMIHGMRRCFHDIYLEVHLLWLRALSRLHFHKTSDFEHLPC